MNFHGLCCYKIKSLFTLVEDPEVCGKLVVAGVLVAVG